MTELTVAIHNLANALEISILTGPQFLASRLCSLSEISPLRIMSVPVAACRYYCTETHNSLIYG